MKYYLAVDSGGTKCSALLYDEEWHVLAHTVAGSVRSSTTPPEQIDEHIRRIAEDVLAPHPEVRGIEVIHGARSDEIADRIAAFVPIARREYESETRLSLSAAEIGAPGLVSLSGTGQFCACIAENGERAGTMGAYGAVVYDEGSGYHIGRLAVSAAVHCDEGHGPATSLCERIMEATGKATVREAVFALNSPRGSMGTITAVASLARLVSAAAAEGDAVALGILRDVGRLLGMQMNCLIRRCGVTENVPFTVAGGCFRGHPSLLETFVSTVRAENPARPFRPPVYEPIVGAVLWRRTRSVGAPDAETLSFFRREYAALRLPDIQLRDIRS